MDESHMRQNPSLEHGWGYGLKMWYSKHPWIQELGVFTLRHSSATAYLQWMCSVAYNSMGRNLLIQTSQVAGNPTQFQLQVFNTAKFATGVEFIHEALIIKSPFERHSY